ncbi:MAG: NADPH-dependent F420 reductase [Gemmatimonadaceae bacterium]
MTTAIIGIGNIGGRLARLLVTGGERVILAARNEAEAATLAKQLGELASVAPVRKAIADADVVVFAVWFDTVKQLIAEHADLLEGKVVVDPSNPMKPDGKGGFARTLPDDQSSGSAIAGLLPTGAHYVKAFGTLGAESLGPAANRTPERAVLFYATDDERAAAAIERLISAAGFDPVKAGGVRDAIRLEVPGDRGDLHQFGGLNGKLLSVDEARAAVAASGRSATQLR